MLLKRVISKSKYYSWILLPRWLPREQYLVRIGLRVSPLRPRWKQLNIYKSLFLGFESKWMQSGVNYPQACLPLDIFYTNLIYIIQALLIRIADATIPSEKLVSWFARKVSEGTGRMSREPLHNRLLGKDQVDLPK